MCTECNYKYQNMHGVQYLSAILLVIALWLSALEWYNENNCTPNKYLKIL